MLVEISPVQKHKYCMFLLTRGSKLAGHFKVESRTMVSRYWGCKE